MKFRTRRMTHACLGLLAAWTLGYAGGAGANDPCPLPLN